MLKLPDFDTLRNLHRNDPRALEQLRKRYIESTIAAASPAVQRRLRGLQFQIDALLRIKPNPTSRCIAVSQMMHSSLLELLQTIDQGTVAQAGSDTERPSAKIFTFPRSAVPPKPE